MQQILPMKLLSIKTVCLATVAAFFFSCNKEVIVEPNINGPAPVNPGGGNPEPGNGNGNGAKTGIEGTYRLVFIAQDGVSITTTGTGADRMSTKYEYKMGYSDIKGTYVIESKNINIKGLSYFFTMSGTMSISGGGFDESLPYQQSGTATLPDAVNTYQMKGTDSIIAKGIVGGSINGGPVSTNTSGISDEQTMHFAFSGDTLIFNGHIEIKNRVVVQNGEQGLVNGYTNNSIKLVRVK